MPFETQTVGPLAEALSARAAPVADERDLDRLLAAIGDARYVLLGEASHGTADYYDWRTRVTMRLVREKGFDVVAVEGDWPDCRQVDRFVRGLPGAPPDALAALRAFQRWPTWMWGNHEVARLADALRAHNLDVPPERRAGFHGLDVYSLWASLDAVRGYVEEHLPEDTGFVRRAQACFGPYGEDAQEYARATVLVPASCEREVVDLLASLRARQDAAPPADDPDAAFDAEQNALVARNAERYYRAMVRGGPESWNVRDRHMVETLERVMAHRGATAKCVVWEHNTHVGDARATDMAASGMVNVGQLVREAHADDEVFILGFGSHRGNVIAGDAWDAPMRRMPVPPARAGSWEDAFHEAGPEDRLLLTADLADVEAAWDPRGHRAIGVVYDPDHERWGNYVPTVLPARYDAFLHVDRSEALHPLRIPVRHDEAPETYPFGD